VDHRKYQELWASTHRGHLLVPTSFLQKSLHIAIDARGPAINFFFNFSGGRCWKYRQHPKGAHHRRLLHLRWWLLSEILTAPPKGPAIDVFFIFGGGYCRTLASTP
jgi:hypothetical protein